MLGPFGLAVALFVLSSTRIGYQDIASLLAGQPSVSHRWRQHVFSPPVGAIHAATFTFPRPLGSSIPEAVTALLSNAESAARETNEAPPTGFQLASYGASPVDVVASIRRAPTALLEREPVVFPVVNRSAKGAFLGIRSAVAPAIEYDARVRAPESEPIELQLASASPQYPHPQYQGHTLDLPSGEAVKDDDLVEGEDAESSARPDSTDPADERSAQDAIEAAIRQGPAPEYDISLSLELHPQIPADDVATENAVAATIATPAFPDGLSEADRTTRLIFGGRPFGQAFAIEPWQRGSEPLLLDRDPDLKEFARRLPRDSSSTRVATAPHDQEPDAGETVAGKGEVTGEGRRPRSVADRLGLAGKARDKAQRCLADAIYFEARGEPVRGQIAVAQVVVNRAFSGYYPDDICGVVYQNAHRRLACQFTFACDGIPDLVKDAQAWARAKRISLETLEGRLWLPEIGKSTHYHASWVRPWWVRSMRKIHKIGVHTFYRPVKWGDGADIPVWGSAALASPGFDSL
jgi:spore germination cell wall hydrolase CwlJ-like protein